MVLPCQDDELGSDTWLQPLRLLVEVALGLWLLGLILGRQHIWEPREPLAGAKKG